MSWLYRIETTCSAISEWIGRGVAWLAVAMVVTQFAVVLLRYGFEFGSIALQQSVSYMHAALFLLAASYALKHDAHVRVDIFYRSASERTKAIVNLAGALLLLTPVSIFILVYSWDYVSSSWVIKEGSNEAGGLDGVWLLKTCIPAMAVLLLVQGVAQIARSLRTLLGEADPHKDEEGVHV